MLGKLFKYDFKAVARYILPLLGLLFLSACGTKLMLELPDNTLVEMLRFFFEVTYAISVIAIGVGAFIVLILHFYKSLMGDQGYLSFSLPVTPGEHLMSKLLNGTFWILLTVLAVFLSILLLTLGHFGADEVKEFLDTLASFVKELETMGFSKWQQVSYLIALPLVGAISIQMGICFCICAGQLFSSHRIIGAFAAFFGWYVANQLCNVALLLFNSQSLRNHPASQDTSFQALPAIGTAVRNLMWESLLLNAGIAVILFFATLYLMERKLNLE